MNYYNDANCSAMQIQINNLSSSSVSFLGFPYPEQHGHVDLKGPSPNGNHCDQIWPGPLYPCVFSTNGKIQFYVLFHIQNVRLRSYCKKLRSSLITRRANSFEAPFLLAVAVGICLKFYTRSSGQGCSISGQVCELSGTASQSCGKIFSR